MELVKKSKNVFGDTVYYIRDQRGMTNVVYENELPGFMKEHGIQELKEGDVYRYPTTKKSHG